MLSLFKKTLLPLALLACENPTPTPIQPNPSFYRGITLVGWTAHGYGTFACQDAIRAIAESGASHLVLIVTGYQAAPNASQIFIDTDRTPTLASIQQAAIWGKEVGLTVILQVQLLSKDDSWSGDIRPGNADAWFSSYGAFLQPWLELAESVDAGQVIIGTELAGTLKHQQKWRNIIANARSHYTGELLYAASWDEAGLVPFWDALDYVGVDFYFPVTHRKNPGRQEIVAGWQPWLNALERLKSQTGKDIILTEIGYRSIDGAGLQPHDFRMRGAIDLEEQANLYWAALYATSGVDWLAGMYWWNWQNDGSGGSQDMDYTPSGKPAQQVLEAWWR